MVGLRKRRRQWCGGMSVGVGGRSGAGNHSHPHAGVAAGEGGSDGGAGGLGAGAAGGLALQRQGEGDAEHAGDLGQGPLLGGKPDLNAGHHRSLGRGVGLVVAHGSTAVRTPGSGGGKRPGPVEPDAFAEGRVLETIRLATRGVIDVRALLTQAGLPAAARLPAVARKAPGGFRVGLLAERLPDRAHQAFAFDIESGHVVAAGSEHHKRVGHGTVSIGVQPSPSPYILRLAAFSSALDSTTSSNTLEN